MYDRPSYLSGALSSSTSAPISSPISPTARAEPAGAAVGDRRDTARGRGPASSTSSTFFSVIALPICTAPPETVSLSCVSSARGERRPVDAVAARAAADGDDQIARLRSP